MSVYKDARSPYWQFDFQVGGHRFYGSTKCTTRREAEAVERSERENAQRYVAQTRAATTSLRLDDVAGGYWQEVAQHFAAARNTERRLGLLITFFSEDRLITDITHDDACAMVAWRRGHRTRRESSDGSAQDVVQAVEIAGPLRARAGMAQALAARATRAPARIGRR